METIIFLKSYKRKYVAEERLKFSDGKESLNARQKYYEKSTHIHSDICQWTCPNADV